MQSRWCAHIWRMHSSLPLPPPAPPAPSMLSTLDHTVKTQHQKVTVSKTGGKIHISTFPLIPHQRDVHRDDHSAPFLYFLWLNVQISIFHFWLDNHLYIVISSTICLYLFFKKFPLWKSSCCYPTHLIFHNHVPQAEINNVVPNWLICFNFYTQFSTLCLMPQWPSLVTGIIKVSFYLPKAVGVSK